MFASIGPSVRGYIGEPACDLRLSRPMFSTIRDPMRVRAFSLNMWFVL